MIHLTSDSDNSTALDHIYSILHSRVLRGSSKYIKGGFNCVCFSETPISKIGFILAQTNQKGFKYSPFGLMFDKKYLFEIGARPVIYQKDIEFESLLDEIKYKHMRFDPSKGIDFTWEREWRLKTDSLELSCLIVHDLQFASNLKR